MSVVGGGAQLFAGQTAACLPEALLGLQPLGAWVSLPAPGAEPCLCRGGPILLRGPGGLSCVFVYESLAALEAGGPLWNPDPSEAHISTGHVSSPDSGFLRRPRSCAGIVWLWV